MAIASASNTPKGNELRRELSSALVALANKPVQHIHHNTTNNIELNLSNDQVVLLATELAKGLKGVDDKLSRKLLKAQPQATKTEKLNRAEMTEYTIAQAAELLRQTPKRLERILFHSGWIKNDSTTNFETVIVDRRATKGVLASRVAVRGEETFNQIIVLRHGLGRVEGLIREYNLNVSMR